MLYLSGFLTYFFLPAPFFLNQSSSFSQFKVCLNYTQREEHRVLFMTMHCSKEEPQGRERCGVFICHLQSIGLKLILNFVGNDCIMGSFEKLQFDWNGKQAILALQIHQRTDWIMKNCSGGMEGVRSGGRYEGETQLKLTLCNGQVGRLWNV